MIKANPHALNRSTEKRIPWLLFDEITSFSWSTAGEIGITISFFLLRYLADPQTRFAFIIFGKPALHWHTGLWGAVSAQSAPKYAEYRRKFSGWLTWVHRMKIRANRTGILGFCLLPTPAESTPTPDLRGFLPTLKPKGSSIPSTQDHFFEGQNPKTGVLQKDVFAPAFALQKNVYSFSFNRKSSNEKKK